MLETFDLQRPSQQFGGGAARGEGEAAAGEGVLLEEKRFELDGKKFPKSASVLVVQYVLFINVVPVHVHFVASPTAGLLLLQFI